MNIGTLTHFVSIEEKVVARNEYGEEVITWSPICNGWASIEPLAGREYFSAGQMQSAVSHRIRMWYQPGIETHHRLTWNDRIFDIEAVLNPEEKNIELALMCSEIK